MARQLEAEAARTAWLLFTETFLPKVDGIVNTLYYLLEHLQWRGI